MHAVFSPPYRNHNFLCQFISAQASLTAWTIFWHYIALIKGIHAATSVNHARDDTTYCRPTRIRCKNVTIVVPKCGVSAISTRAKQGFEEHADACAQAHRRGLAQRVYNLRINLKIKRSSDDAAVSLPCVIDMRLCVITPPITALRSTPTQTRNKKTVPWWCEI